MTRELYNAVGGQKALSTREITLFTGDINEYDISEDWALHCEEDEEATAISRMDMSSSWPRLVSVEVQDLVLGVTYYIDRDQAEAVLGYDVISEAELRAAEVMA